MGGSMVVVVEEEGMGAGMDARVGVGSVVAVLVVLMAGSVLVPPPPPPLPSVGALSVVGGVVAVGVIPCPTILLTGAVVEVDEAVTLAVGADVGVGVELDADADAAADVTVVEVTVVAVAVAVVAVIDEVVEAKDVAVIEVEVAVTAVVMDVAVVVVAVAAVLMVAAVVASGEHLQILLECVLSQRLDSVLPQPRSSFHAPTHVLPKLWQ
jgi:hypothetical protein